MLTFTPAFGCGMVITVSSYFPVAACMSATRRGYFF
jgi:hypothetical protein